MFYNNLLSIPVIVTCSLFLEDWSQANIDRNFPPELRSNLMFAILFSGLSSVFISYTSAWCVRVASSTTYSMVGALNKLPIAVSGLVFFDAPITFPSVSVSSVHIQLVCIIVLTRLSRLLHLGSFPVSCMHWQK
jgi:GDP-mannose transporter